MSRRQQRRAERRALLGQAQELVPEELGRILAVLLASTLLGVVLELVLLVLAARAGVDAWRRRTAGFREVLRSGRVRGALGLLAVSVGYRVATRSLVIAWIRRSVRRAETSGTEGT